MTFYRRAVNKIWLCVNTILVRPTMLWTCLWRLSLDYAAPYLILECSSYCKTKGGENLANILRLDSCTLTTKLVQDNYDLIAISLARFQVFKSKTPWQHYCALTRLLYFTCDPTWKLQVEHVLLDKQTSTPKRLPTRLKHILGKVCGTGTLRCSWLTVFVQT